VASDDLARALLLEEAASREAIAEALFASVSGGVSFVQALVDGGEISVATLERYFVRAPAPSLRQVLPVDALVDRLPRGLCGRLLAVPVRREPITGTIDVAVADATDPHPAAEIGFHLGAPVRTVRAPLHALEEALRRIRMREHDEGASAHGGDAAFVGPSSRRYDDTTVDAPLSRRLVIEADSSPPAPRIRTPPWGTPVHVQRTEPPKSGLGSEIPIPLTRKSLGPQAIVHVLRGGTERPPAISLAPLGSFIPGPPPVPGPTSITGARPPPDVGSVIAAIRNAGTRDEVLELVLTGARLVAAKVALFVVKRGGYLGWACSPEFGDRAQLSSVLIPLQAPSIFDRAIREDVYLGPVRYDEVHAPLLRVMKNPTRDVAAVPIRVSGKTAVIVLADDLADTMTATRRLEEIAKSAGEAFARILRSKR
jgi:hypothetical protein